MERDKIIQFCSEYLEVEKFDDACHNGLQVEGAEEVNKIITGVSLSAQLIEAAIKNKAEMIMVHHGLFKNSIPELPVLQGVIRNRVKMLLCNNINLAGYHLPLDFHNKIGNNALLCEKLEIGNWKLLEMGCVGELDKEIDFKDFVDIVNSKLGVNSIVISGGGKKAKIIGVSSGGASPYYQDFIDAGADTFLTGDIRENIVRGVEEQGLNFINAGHYNTEKLGIKALGELVNKEFGVEVEFVDVPNSI